MGKFTTFYYTTLFSKGIIRDKNIVVVEVSISSKDYSSNRLRAK